MPNLEQAIRERAYHLWLADGCRDGAADAYWLTAQREVLSATLSNSVIETSPEVAVAKPKAPAKAKAAKAAEPKVASKPAAPAKSKRRAA